MEIAAEIQDFNVENPFNKEEKKARTPVNKISL
jgi:hypothetical protein